MAQLPTNRLHRLRAVESPDATGLFNGLRRWKEPPIQVCPVGQPTVPILCRVDEPVFKQSGPCLRQVSNSATRTKSARPLHSCSVGQCITAGPQVALVITNEQFRVGNSSISASFLSVNRIIGVSPRWRRGTVQTLLIENSLRQVTHGFMLALGVAILVTAASCGIDEAASGSRVAPAETPPAPFAASGFTQSPPLTDAVIPPRLPGMIGASRPIHLESRSIALHLVDVLSRDSITAIDNPTFLSSGEAAPHLSGDDFVIGLSVANEQRAYPTAYLSSYEIVNDVVGGMPVAVTW